MLCLLSNIYHPWNTNDQSPKPNTRTINTFPAKTLRGDTIMQGVFWVKKLVIYGNWCLIFVFLGEILSKNTEKNPEVYHNFFNHILRKIDIQFSISLRYLNKYPGLGFCIRTNWATLKTEGNVSKPVSVIEVTETHYKQFVSFLFMGIWNFSEVPNEENVN